LDHECPSIIPLHHIADRTSQATTRMADPKEFLLPVATKLYSDNSYWPATPIPGSHSCPAASI
jgi:hypothetical protein